MKNNNVVYGIMNDQELLYIGQAKCFTRRKA